MVDEEKSFTSANVPESTQEYTNTNLKSVDATRGSTDKTKDDKYAQALAQMATMDYAMEQKSKPGVKHLISKKWLIYIVISLVLSVLSLVFMGGGSEKKAQDTEKTQQILNGTQELLDSEKTQQPQ